MGDTVLTGRLWDNANARSLITQLPLTVNLRNHNGQEKTRHLPQVLSMDGMPEGDDPVPQDIGYYAPSGNIVFYYGDVGYWNGIARIGEFDSSMDVIKDQTGDFRARIELAN
ncbi:cyclophilin-like fold protein [Arthrobacter sp. ISL-30]|uniref:cyclophilin-like fold protein n=1 Tax=Arthrobacter sp. ISL-30 TaxID=2819109 RepID=UPI0027E18257|nr:cyclophilin-like fold protein [Arthrobacter sp. ISL-30]